MRVIKSPAFAADPLVVTAFWTQLKTTDDAATGEERPPLPGEFHGLLVIHW